ncbi:hypothetical protein PRK78_003074 [Emydomyces testavorans]|uniref:FAD-binding domain-containing protein n=1 Tax=Emydomyces testavorans TaxID=2070801 RepID=A0AAF0DHG8_9EURO|nr:hypothetical protein PRK78_003074 [Emydomyces testavorans]
MTTSNICIIGGGICGVASALALSKFLPQNRTEIAVYELRDKPTTLGGPIHLTPNALRALDSLGTYKILQKENMGVEVGSIDIYSIQSGSAMGSIDFAGPDGQGFDGYKGRRIMRAQLLRGLLEAVKDCKNVKVMYGKKLVGVKESDKAVCVSFADGTTVSADLVLGCDGVHSMTRMSFVEPDRVPIYTGISTAQGYVKAEKITSPLHLKDTTMNSGRKGSLLISYFEPTYETIYLAAVTEAKEDLSKDGWNAVGKDQDLIKRNLTDRFGDAAFPCIKEMISKAENWFLYPVYKLAPHGKWATKRVILLGDAAHAMPPQGESIGYALEDALLFARALAKHQEQSLDGAFQAYETLRRKRIEDAHREASMRWETVRDSGYIVTKLKEWIVPVWLWWMRSAQIKAFLFDCEKVEIP